jgi:hypothetical protein
LEIVRSTLAAVLTYRVDPVVSANFLNFLPFRVPRKFRKFRKFGDHQGLISRDEPSPHVSDRRGSKGVRADH